MTDLELLAILAALGTAVFAISGALQALRNDMDIVGVTFIACVTGVGGGTMRDIFLGDTPVQWVQDPTDIFVCIGAAMVTALVNRKITGRRMDALLWADAVGLSLFAVLGAAKAAELGAHPFAVVLFGAMSATFGGIIRDIICNEVPVLFRKEIYITAALFGSTVYVVLPETLGFEVRTGIGVTACFLLRALSMRFAWALPRINR